MFVSIINDVLGPIMRGPSSSHTAGSYHIGRTLGTMLTAEPRTARFTFDRNGSYAETYSQQGADRGFILGLMGIPLIDERFFTAFETASRDGIEVEFAVSDLDCPDHPNKVEIELTSRTGDSLTAAAASIGGGTFRISSVNGWPVEIRGKQYHLLIVCARHAQQRVIDVLKRAPASIETRADDALIVWNGDSCPEEAMVSALKTLQGVKKVISVEPVYHTQKGAVLFHSAGEMVAYAENNALTLGQAALRYEAQLLGLTPQQVLDEMVRRFAIMKDSVHSGLDNSKVNMQLLEPTASAIAAAEKSKQLPVGGLHTRAAVNAMAAMHTCNSMAVVCAAPTGGSAGVIPGTLVAWADEVKAEPEQVAMMLLAAGAIGVIVAIRATFAAEVAGCQVEIGAAGAMAAAAVVEYANGTAAQAADAAAISFQNTMGSVCDLVQGTCEIPCHTRNAAASSSAFVCADLILGGYHNPIHLDETIDAVYDCGKLLPSELRCTSKGGIAMAPSARTMKRRM
jgi:L-serine dehydratase